MNALAEQLRSVFVPYFRNLLDLAVGNLTHGTEAKQSGKKKRKKVADGVSDSEDSWLLRLRVSWIAPNILAPHLPLPPKPQDADLPTGMFVCHRCYVLCIAASCMIP